MWSGVFHARKWMWSHEKMQVRTRSQIDECSNFSGIRITQVDLTMISWFCLLTLTWWRELWWPWIQIVYPMRKQCIIKRQIAASPFHRYFIIFARNLKGRQQTCISTVIQPDKAFKVVIQTNVTSSFWPPIRHQSPIWPPYSPMKLNVPRQ